MSELMAVNIPVSIFPKRKKKKQAAAFNVFTRRPCISLQTGENMEPWGAALGIKLLFYHSSPVPAC